MESEVKSLFSYITLASFILSGGALAEEVNGKWGTKNFYGFAEIGIAQSDMELDATSTTAGSLTLSTNLDKRATISKLGFGVSVAEKTSVEVYSGRISGASATYNITATNAVVSDGTTWNGSLTAIADASVDLIGVNLVRSDSINFKNDNE